MTATTKPIPRRAGFVRLDHALLDSDEWRSLHPDAVVVLLDMWRRHDGRNNGMIPYSRRDAHQCLIRHHGKKVSTRRATAALRQIQDKGLATITRRGSFAFKRQASTWRIAVQPVTTGPKNSETRDHHGPYGEITGTTTAPMAKLQGPRWSLCGNTIPSP